MPHRIERELDIRDFIAIIADVDIIVTSHALFRVHEGQRKFYKDYLLADVLKAQLPFRVGIQSNGNYAAFYRHGKDILRVVLDIRHDSVKIVTFYITPP